MSINNRSSSFNDHRTGLSFVSGSVEVYGHIQESRKACEELNIPICENEPTDFSVPFSWESPVLGTLIAKDSIEKKIQEYFTEKLKNLENAQFGFFYKIKDSSNKTRGYLFGTIHDMTPVVAENLEVRKFLFGTINDHLNLHKKIYKSFSKAAHAAFENDPVKWQRALFDRSLDDMENEAKSSQKMDLEFSVLAYRQIKTIHELESLHLPTSSPEQQTKAKPNWALLHAALYESSETKLEEVLKEIDTPKDTRELNDRNEKMAEKITQLLESCGEKKIFVAVGAAHMVGEKGIPNLLSQKSYQTKQVKPCINDIFTKAISKDFFSLSTGTLQFIARSISGIGYAPSHRDMALYNIVEILLEKASEPSKTFIGQSALFIAEKMYPGGPHREYALSEIAAYETKQGNIEGALAIAVKMEKDPFDHSNIFAYIADHLVSQGNIKQAINIMEKYAPSFPLRYPGKVALDLAKQEKIQEAIDVAASISHWKHCNATFAAIAVIMARRGETLPALNIVETRIHNKELAIVTKDAINKIKTIDNVNNELKEVRRKEKVHREFKPLFISEDELSDCLYKLCKSLEESALSSAFE